MPRNATRRFSTGKLAVSSRRTHQAGDHHEQAQLAVFPRGADKNDKRRQVNEKTNEIISKLHDGKNIHDLDIGPKFLEDDGTLTREIMPDLLHLSQKGYTIGAESIEQQLANLLGE